MTIEFDGNTFEYDTFNMDEAEIDYITVTTETGTYVRMVGVPFCPDMLRYEDIGEADNMRGRVVRGFFWMMRWWR